MEQWNEAIAPYLSGAELRVFQQLSAATQQAFCHAVVLHMLSLSRSGNAFYEGARFARQLISTNGPTKATNDKECK